MKTEPLPSSFMAIRVLISSSIAFFVLEFLPSFFVSGKGNFLSVLGICRVHNIAFGIRCPLPH